MSEEQAMKASTTERKILGVGDEVGVVMEALLAREFVVTGIGKAATERVRARGVRCCPCGVFEGNERNHEFARQGRDAAAR
jgi:cation transport regulator ChaC